MLSELSYSRLEKEIGILRLDLNNLWLDLNNLSLELNFQQMYQTFYDPALLDWETIERKRALYHWKKTRLAALELFAHAQYAITDIQSAVQSAMQPAMQPACTNRTIKRKKRSKKNGKATAPSRDPNLGSTRRNRTKNDSNKENQRLPSQDEIIQNIKIEDGQENIAHQTIAERLKNMKKENVDYEENSVLNNNIDSNFIPQLMPAANIKTEVDCAFNS